MIACGLSTHLYCHGGSRGWWFLWQHRRRNKYRSPLPQSHKPYSREPGNRSTNYSRIPAEQKGHHWVYIVWDWGLQPNFVIILHSPAWAYIPLMGVKCTGFSLWGPMIRIPWALHIHWGTTFSSHNTFFYSDPLELTFPDNQSIFKHVLHHVYYIFLKIWNRRNVLAWVIF